MRTNLGKLKGIALGAMLASCTANQPKSREEKKSTPEAKRYYITQTSFADYKPCLTQEQIHLPEPLNKVLFDGLDSYDNNVQGGVRIQEYGNFERFIYAEAKKLGHDESGVRSFSPKEAAVLASKIVAKNVDYFGRTLDYEGSKRKEEKLSQWKEALEKIVVDATLIEEKRKIAKDGLTAIERLKEIYIDMMLQEQKIVAAASVAVSLTDIDIAPIDTLLQARKDMICRNYARVVEGIFYVLKNGNPQLKNAHVARYRGNRHCWNQIATVYQEKNHVEIQVSFFDPTFLDGVGEIEGYDRAHFPYDFSELDKQIADVQTKIALAQQTKLEKVAQTK